MVGASLRGIPAACLVVSLSSYILDCGAAYLELSQAEATASTNTAVVLDGGAADDGSQFVGWARGNGSSLCLAGISAGLLATGLDGNDDQDLVSDCRRHCSHVTERGIT